jgi:putative CocE/NonD family hydrolase
MKRTISEIPRGKWTVQYPDEPITVQPRYRGQHLLHVDENGKAWNLDETIQRMRYRNGYEKPLAWMEAGKVYKVVFQPMTTSNYFAPGHRIRIEISSSNFPRFDRNMNTGGNNYNEVKGVIARNSVHHSKQYPAELTITVVKKK